MISINCFFWLFKIPHPILILIFFHGMYVASFDIALATTMHTDLILDLSKVCGVQHHKEHFFSMEHQTIKGQTFTQTQLHIFQLLLK